MDAKKFRTRQESGRLTYPKGKDFIIGLDAGYSGMKVFFETGYNCFPSFAKKMDDNMMNLTDEKDILYRDDETQEVYMVGYNAQNMIDDTNDTDGELYSRKRYSDPRFRVVCYTAIGLASMHKLDARKIVIQTGLPSSYMKDASALKKALSDIPRFSLKIGNSGNWIPFRINIPQEDISVMAQPMGALYSVITRNDGSFVPDAMAMLKGNVIVLDAGFGTFDFYGVKERHIDCQDSINDISMREIFIRTTRKIAEEFGEEVRVPALQKNLTDGMITCINEDDMTAEERSFVPLLEEANREVLESAKSKIRSVTNSFRGYQYLIIDGGTGEAWYDDICQWLSNMKTLKIIPSNVNDHLPFIYSNARGYYMYRFTKNRK